MGVCMSFSIVSSRELPFLTRSIFVFCLLFAGSAGTSCFAQDVASPPLENRPPILDSFSGTELVLGSTTLLGLGILSIWGEEWIGPDAPSMGAPSEGSVDLRFSRWANPDFDPKQKWLGGAPDLLGYAAPALALGYYVGGSIISGGEGWGGAHPHEAIAFAEGLSWAMFSTTLLKRIVGRERPFVARGALGEIDTDAVEMSRSERLLSFPSGHSTSIAATSFFIAADVSDALVSGPLKSKPIWVKGLVGRALPYLSATGLSWLVMYSRIKDQRHWLSDTLTGGVIGALGGLISYHIHFDSSGEPYSARP